MGDLPRPAQPGQRRDVGLRRRARHRTGQGPGRDRQVERGRARHPCRRHRAQRRGHQVQQQPADAERVAVRPDLAGARARPVRRPGRGDAPGGRADPGGRARQPRPGRHRCARRARGPRAGRRVEELQLRRRRRVRRRRQRRGSGDLLDRLAEDLRHRGGRRLAVQDHPRQGRGRDLRVQRRGRVHELLRQRQGQRRRLGHRAGRRRVGGGHHRQGRRARRRRRPSHDRRRRGHHPRQPRPGRRRARRRGVRRRRGQRWPHLRQGGRARRGRAVRRRARSGRGRGRLRRRRRRGRHRGSRRPQRLGSVAGSRSTRARSPSTPSSAWRSASAARWRAASPSTCPRCTRAARTPSSGSEDCSDGDVDTAAPDPGPAAQRELGGRRARLARRPERRAAGRPRRARRRLQPHHHGVRRLAHRRRQHGRHRRREPGEDRGGGRGGRAARPPRGRVRHRAGSHAGRRRRDRGRRPTPRPAPAAAAARLRRPRRPRPPGDRHPHAHLHLRPVRRHGPGVHRLPGLDRAGRSRRRIDRLDTGLAVSVRLFLRQTAGHGGLRLRLRRRQQGPARPARRQGSQPRGDDEPGAPRAPGIHHHHRGLPRLPARRRRAGGAGRGGQ